MKLKLQDAFVQHAHVNTQKHQPCFSTLCLRCEGGCLGAGGGGAGCATNNVPELSY